MTGPLTGKRILIVEDEYFIAADLRRALSEQGAAVIGPARNAGRGEALCDEPLDAAVLDINLEGVASFDLAHRLEEKGVPFMFVTGYDTWAIPEEYRAAPRLTKPCRMEQMVSALEDLVQAR